MHYQCKDCGYYSGIQYGICEECTPKSILEEIQVLENKMKTLTILYGILGCEDIKEYQDVKLKLSDIWVGIHEHRRNIIQ